MDNAINLTISWLFRTFAFLIFALSLWNVLNFWYLYFTSDNVELYGYPGLAGIHTYIGAACLMLAFAAFLMSFSLKPKAKKELRWTIAASVVLVLANALIIMVFLA